MYRLHRLAALIPSFVAVALTGCASSTDVSGGGSAASDETAFDNFLVLAVAENYNNRAQFERTVVSNLKSKGADATTYYSAAGGNTPIDREAVKIVMETGPYDALLVTRVLAASSDAEMKTGSAAAKATRRDGGPLDFFRYDYEELDEPGALSISTEATLSVELYRASDSTKVWATVLTSKGEDNVGAMIDDVADKVVSQLTRNRKIAR